MDDADDDQVLSLAYVYAHADEAHARRSFFLPHHRDDADGHDDFPCVDVFVDKNYCLVAAAAVTGAS